MPPALTSSSAPIPIPSSGSTRKRSLSTSRAAAAKLAQFFSSSPKSANSLPSHITASAALLAAQDHLNGRSTSSSLSLPTISLSTATAETTQDPDSSTTMLFSPPSPEQARKIAREHAQFAPITHPSHQYVSVHPEGKPVRDPVEDEPPYYYLLTTYISYLILIIFGHVRDFFGKIFREKNYKHLKTQNVHCHIRKVTL